MAQICAACYNNFKVDKNTVDFNDRFDRSGDSPNWLAVYEEVFTKLPPHLQEGLPNKLCDTCSRQMRDVMNLHTQAKSSYAILKTIFGTDNNVGADMGASAEQMEADGVEDLVKVTQHMEDPVADVSQSVGNMEICPDGTSGILKRPLEVSLQEAGSSAQPRAKKPNTPRPCEVCGRMLKPASFRRHNLIYHNAVPMTSRRKTKVNMVFRPIQKCVCPKGDTDQFIVVD